MKSFLQSSKDINKGCPHIIPRQKGLKLLDKICELMCIEASPNMLIIYHVVWNIEYLCNTYIVSILCIHLYVCIIYFSYFYYGLYLYYVLLKINIHINCIKKWMIIYLKVYYLHVKRTNSANLLIYWIKLKLNIWIEE